MSFRLRLEGSVASRWRNDAAVSHADTPCVIYRRTFEQSRSESAGYIWCRVVYVYVKISPNSRWYMIVFRIFWNCSILQPVFDERVWNFQNCSKLFRMLRNCRFKGESASWDKLLSILINFDPYILSADTWKISDGPVKEWRSGVTDVCSTLSLRREWNVWGYARAGPMSQRILVYCGYVRTWHI